MLSSRIGLQIDPFFMTFENYSIYFDTLFLTSHGRIIWKYSNSQIVD